ncbi:MAG: (Fe-S)-binding protein [Chloroflexi bacterium]|nr:(Fe-S)-binding protein [Chloroflexota bacterium]
MIITPCPECYQTLKVDYSQHLGALGAEVVHLSQFLAERLDKLHLERGSEKTVTYHDPCRLGRFSGLFDQPRRILAALPGIERREMSRSRALAGCCGAHAWNNCGAIAKGIQLDRLQEARSTGASVLVTACPKCEIHFKCSMQNHGATRDYEIEVRDLFSLVAELIE